MIIPPFPTKVEGIDVVCPQLQIPHEVCSIALDVLSSELFKEEIQARRVICGAYAWTIKSKRKCTAMMAFVTSCSFTDKVAEALGDHMYLTSYIREEFGTPPFNVDKALDLRKAWVAHIVEHLRKGLES